MDEWEEDTVIDTPREERDLFAWDEPNVLL